LKSGIQVCVSPLNGIQEVRGSNPLGSTIRFSSARTTSEVSFKTSKAIGNILSRKVLAWVMLWLGIAWLDTN
jgi:hypothetical protein